MDEKTINEAMDNRFDGIESCVIIEELLELEAENKWLIRYRDYVESRIRKNILPKLYREWKKDVEDLAKELEKVL